MEGLPDLIDSDGVVGELPALAFDPGTVDGVEARGCAGALRESVAEFLGDGLACCPMAVERENERIEADIGEAVLNDFQRSRLLGDKEDGLAITKQLGDDVGDGLRLPRAGRAVHHEAVALPGGDEASALGGVGIEYARQVFRRVSVVESLLRLRSEGHGFKLGAGWSFRQEPDHGVGGDGVLVYPKVAIDHLLLERESAEHGSLINSPARPINGVAHGSHGGGVAVVLKFVECGQDDAVSFQPHRQTRVESRLAIIRAD